VGRRTRRPWVRPAAICAERLIAERHDLGDDRLRRQRPILKNDGCGIGRYLLLASKLLLPSVIEGRMVAT